LGGFACFSPFNSFRINESFSELSKICIQLRHIYARNPFGISTRCAHLQHVHFHPLTVSIPYSCFVSFTPSLFHSLFHFFTLSLLHSRPPPPSTTQFPYEPS
jgi:hypothetical protein